MVDIGCACLTPRKACLGTANVVLCILAAIFMVCACASFGPGNTKNVPWFTTSIVFTYSDALPAPQKGTTVTSSGFVGIAGALGCFKADNADVANAYATSVGSDLKPGADSYVCTNMDMTDKDAKTGYGTMQMGCGGPCVSIYSASYNYNAAADISGAPDVSCSATVDTWKDDGKKAFDDQSACYKLALCYGGGALVFGFALTGLLFSLFTLICFLWRKNGDGCCAKTLTFLFTLIVFVTALVSFVAYGPCSNVSNQAIIAANKAAKDQIGSDKTYSAYSASLGPGAGGLMSLMGCLVFFYVMVMNVLIKIEGADAAAANSGLDTKV